ncbi:MULTISPECIES: DUF6160 family protein [Marinobacter]|jgi:hypothetical protein|uniref:DUF6160 family protein n=1 Tax=Marinobacter alkaliphilus TaxID=254719 RepID=A0ABZ3DYA9_9GAMM|nr:MULTISPECIES: DUF6160 family protein [Marinobacter]MCD1630346.1 DUF6160 family protein [Marinobacter shengliensis]QFS87328.1 hypothetical protein FIV08_10855 [Marinobacter sp. THAF197a]QFT51112.1 hypothetical protein FIU96_10770 [Marinobacter sp. THAF39]
MKGLKPTMLALCVAGAAPAAMAFQPLDEISMGNITGQAGVTIELETRLNIDRFIYTDEGSLVINDISVGGANRIDLFPELGFNLTGAGPSDKLDNVRINIDIANDGDAIINILPMTFGAVDMRITTGAWDLTGTDGSTTIMDNFQMDMLIGSGTIRVDTATDTLRLLTDFAIDDLDFDIPFLAMGIRDLRLTGADYDLQAPQPLRLFANVDLDIFKGANAAGTEVLAIEMDSFRADLSIGGVLIGGTSIGSVMLDDLAITNTSMRIYGH